VGILPSFAILDVGPARSALAIFWIGIGRRDRAKRSGETCASFCAREEGFLSMPASARVGLESGSAAALHSLRRRPTPFSPPPANRRLLLNQHLAELALGAHPDFDGPLLLSGARAYALFRIGRMQECGRPERASAGRGPHTMASSKSPRFDAIYRINAKCLGPKRWYHH
jgi:hypothetical protein